ncbi:MAG TPA: ATP-binding protein [Candidatus Obscuribacterales bacterium]
MWFGEHWTLKFRIWLAFALTVLLLGLTWFSSLSYFTDLIRASKWVDHTQKVLIGLEATSASIREAESYARGYIILGNEVLLRQYIAAKEGVRFNYRKLAGLVAEEREQRLDLPALHAKVQQKVDFMDSYTHLRREKGAAAATVLMRTGTGIRLTNEIEELLETMKERESLLLAHQLSNLKQSGRKVMLTLTLLGLLAFATLSSAFFFTHKYMNERRRAERAAVRRAEQLALSSDIGAIMTGADSLQQLLQSCTETVVKHLHAAFARIWILNSQTHMLELKASAGTYTHLDGRHSQIPVGQLKIGQIALEKRALVTENVQEDAKIADKNWAREQGIVSFAGQPLLIAGELVGVLGVFSRNPLPDDVLLLLAAVADNIAVGIEHRNAEELRHQAERRFRAIFEQTFEFLGLLLPDGTLIEANRAALEFIGVQAADVVGRPFWETPWWAHSAELQERLKDAIRRAAAGEFVRMEADHTGPKGKIDVDFSLAPIKDEDGRVVLLIPEARDITDRIEAERRVSDFYSTISHELRTPLTSIRAALGLLEAGATMRLPEKDVKLLTIARGETDRLIRLVNDILDLRKIQSGKVELRTACCQSGDLVDRTIDIASGMAEECNLHLIDDVRVAQQLECDPDRIIQVLTNLVSNAIKFSPSGAEILVSTEVAGPDNLRFTVTDRGPGIPPEQGHKLFVPFQQLDSSNARRNGGSGLGLSISKLIVEQHHGQIGFQNMPEGGCQLWFELPLHQSATPVAP